MESLVVPATGVTMFLSSVRVRGGSLLLGQDPHDFVEQVARPGAVGRGNTPKLAQAQAVELIGVKHLFAGVNLVHAENDGLLGAAQHVRYLGIIIRDAGGRLHHEDDGVGLLYGYLHLTADGLLEYILGVGGISAGIDYGELRAAPFAFAVMPVAGDTGGVVHDGLPHAHQTVEEGRFPYVRSPDYRYQAPNLCSL